MNRDVHIAVRNLTAHYGDALILDDLSFDVHRGEIFVIIGASGCGKTTLLKHMAGLYTPTSGSIRYGDQDITRLDEDALSRVQQGIGIAFQSGGLFNSLTVGENVALPLHEYGGIDDPGQLDALVRLKLSMVGLAPAQHKLPAELSGGMRKRAGLARAIALDPPVVYFDEPSAGLDPIMAAGLDELIRDLRRLLGNTFIIVTHELDSIRSITDRLIMLDRGRIIFEGTVSDAEASTNDRVRQFFERRPDAFMAHRNA